MDVVLIKSQYLQEQTKKVVLVTLLNLGAVQMEKPKHKVPTWKVVKTVQQLNLVVVLTISLLHLMERVVDVLVQNMDAVLMVRLKLLVQSLKDVVNFLDRNVAK